MGVTIKKCHRIMSGNDCWNILWRSVLTLERTVLWENVV